jgi:periplasmic divalent cation tolerance protein
MSFSPRLVFITCPSLAEARHLARILLEKRLAACVNLVPGVESHYWWKGKLEQAAEVLLLAKSSAAQFEALRELVALHHSYDCPEVVGIDPHEIAPVYRLWWEESLGSAAGGPDPSASSG